MGTGSKMAKSAAIATAPIMAALMVAMTTAGAGNAQTAVNGETAFKQRCSTCHSILKGKVSPVGPNLLGVAGRKAGATGYAYSPALKKSGLVWNTANLDKYLAAPTKTVPGTKMVIGVADAKQRAAIIAFLGKVK
jgi:cytochrome c